MGRRDRAVHAPLWWSLLLTTIACTTNLALPDGSKITCRSTDECPDDLVCAASLGRCMPSAVVNACVSKDEGAGCSYPGVDDGVCGAGVCYPAGCGNGVREVGEACDDGNTESGDDCSADCLSTEACGNGIRDPGEGCDCGDGTVALPAGCSEANSAATSASCRGDCQLPGCHDGVVAGLEQCEPGLALPTTCAALGFYAGALSCNDSCLFDLTSCSGRCGDAVINGDEDCDTLDLGSESCASLGFYEETAPLACSAICSFDVSGCSGECGDGIKNGPEQCDEDDVGGVDCTDLGFYDPGTPTCTRACGLATSACTGYCGDRLLNGPEACDGATPPGESCLGFGYDAGVLSCLGVCAPDLSLCRGHVRTAALSSGASAELRAIWGSPATGTYAVGDGGLILHSDGGAWTQVGAGLTTRPLLSVTGDGTGDVFIVGGDWGSQGVLLHYDSSTTTWSSTLWPAVIWSVFATEPGNVWAAGLGYALYWNGATWIDWAFTTANYSKFDARRLLGVWGTGPSDVWIVGETYDGTASIYHYDGSMWTEEVDPGTSFGLTAIWGTGAGDVFAVGANGSVVHHDGAGWTPMLTDTTDYLTGVWGSGSTDVYATMRTATSRALYHYDGTSWSRLGTADLPQLNGIWGRGLGDALVVGSGGAIIQLDGSRWTPLRSGTTEYLLAVAGSPTDLYAVGGQFSGTPHGTVFHYDGKTWSNVSQLNGPPLMGVWRAGPDEVYAVGYSSGDYSGTIRVWNGNQWTATATPIGSGLRGVWASGPGDVYAVGGGYGAYGSGVVMHLETGAWVPTSVSGPLAAVWGSGPDDVFAVGEAGLIVHYGGSAWLPMDSGTAFALSSVWGSGPDDVFAVGQAGTILHYDGVQWSPMTSGTAVWLADVEGIGPESVTAVGDAGTVLHYDGAVWSPVRAGTTSSMSAIHSSPGFDLAVGYLGLARAHGRSCAGSESLCSDGLDDDCDGRADCADTDCVGDAYCAEGGACAGALAASCAEVIDGSTEGAANEIDRYACSPWLELGRERSYRFVAPAAGSVTVTLTSAVDLDLIVLHEAASGACMPKNPGCVGASSTAQVESVSFTAEAGAAYYFVVDGYGGDVGDFALEVTCL